MKVFLSPRAVDDLRAIQAYVAYYNVSAAARIASRIRSVVALLGDHPRIGQVYETGPERRLVVPEFPYCVYYDLDEPGGWVNVLTIQHTHRLPPKFR